MRALDLFCGAGLSSVGARAAGVNMVGAVDVCPIATTTYIKNFPGAIVINKRLEKVSAPKLRDEIGDIDLLLASPECTNHTCAKGSAPRSESSRATAMHVLRFAKAFEPRWIIMENVVHMRPWLRYEEFISKLKEMGYHIREQVLDSSKFSVPQKRRRLFVICDKQAMPAEVSPTSATVAAAWDIVDPEHKWGMTPLFRDGRAKDTVSRARRAMVALGEDTGFLIVYYGTDGCGGWQPLTRPLRTVTTLDRFALVLPTQDGHMMRMLQVPELKRAMGLMEEFELPIGTRRDKIRLLGNGVCPPVVTAVVKKLSEGCEV